MKALFVLSFLCLAACNHPNDRCAAWPSADLSKPGVLVVGDSISLGYTPFVQQDLPSADVIHSPCNDESSTNAQLNMKMWVEYRPSWKVITFNHGMWDIPPGPESTSIENYQANLRREGTFYMEHAPKVVFFTTTEVPAQANAGFTNADVDQYNQAAVQVMNELGIEVVDLNAYSKTIDQLHIDPTNIHWSPQGYQDLAGVVSQAIAGAL